HYRGRLVQRARRREGPAPGSAATSSAHRFLHERADPYLVGGGQLLQRKGDRPHGSFVEVCFVAEAERRVSRLELVRALEEADDIAVLGIRGHPVPGSRREGWRAGLDDGMEPLGHGAIRFRHLGNLREHVTFPIRLLRARASARLRLQLLGALLHCDAFLVRESLDRLAGHGSALGGLLCLLLRSHRASSYATPMLSKPITASVYLHRGNLGRAGVSTRDKRRSVDQSNQLRDAGAK